MRSNPFISICIPAYKNTVYLQRLLNSIAIQSFKDFEVVITDDSPDESVETFIRSNNWEFALVYIRNQTPLGSPENWNASIRLAKGEWIKMMHDDDWFSRRDSLEVFANTVVQHPQSSFIFSGYKEVNKDNKEHAVTINNLYLFLLKQSSFLLLKRNFIGHPSTTLIKNDWRLYYDKNLKWVVDIEFYMRYLNNNPQLIAIKQPLISIGINDFQITKQAFRNPAIELPETLYLYWRLPKHFLRNIFAYDYYWRLLRNLRITGVLEIQRYAPDVEVPVTIVQMIAAQSDWSNKLLQVGIISKMLMFTSYLKNYRSL
jgi:glycosyltransferase involved in cell wall biosynthesis